MISSMKIWRVYENHLTQYTRIGPESIEIIQKWATVKTLRIFGDILSDALIDSSLHDGGHGRHPATLL